MLEFDEHGPPEAPSVLLLHGGGASGWMWLPALAHLGSFHCLVPDMPEHGSNAAQGPFTISGAAAAMAALIRARAHGGRAHVVGLSLGAQVALQLAATEPGLVDRLVVTGLSLHPAPGMGLVRHPLGRRLTLALLEAYWQWRMAPWLLRANMRGFGIPASHTEAFAADTRAMSAEALLRIVFDESQGFTLPAGLGQSPVPALVLAGERELPVVHRSAAELQAVMPGAVGGLVPGARHNWPLEAPERFARVVGPWLAAGSVAPGLLPLPSTGP